ncbi:MAG: radical SAM protein [Deltaproteobacteria bacterium]|jgi:radical SAM protein with 4Fe4S-binding SPASM domain|nr:radical SAM protein [Deltaproteobacteria bacterium]
MVDQKKPKPSHLREVGGDLLGVSRFLARKDPLSLLAEELGEKFVSYRQQWDLASSLDYLPPFPLQVDYELKTQCNLRCPICPHSQGLPPSGELDKDLALSLIKEGAQEGQLALGFGGLWEPLTSPHLAELIEVARSAGLIDAMLNTNGQLLTKERSKELIKAGLTRIMISVDAATPETYRKARPGGDYALLVENILGFLAVRQSLGQKLPILRLSFCVTRYNEGELSAFLAKWSELVEFFSIQSYGRFPGGSSSLFPKNRPFPKPGGICSQPRQRLLIRASGEVLPCCDLSGLGLGAELGLGRVPAKSLKEIWASEGLRDLRRRLMGPKDNWPNICQECQAKYQAA